MRKPARRPARWQPCPRELLLLRAATLEAAPALEAWKRWRLEGDEKADDSYRAYFPLIWRNLADDLGDDPLKEDLRDAYRQTWAHNQFLLGRCAGTLGALRDAGVPTLVLKGAALSARYYGDPGVRPMGDVDVLVPRDRLIDADAVLQHGGWYPHHPTYLQTTGARRSERLHEVGGGKLDLHWRLAQMPGREEETWRSAVPVDIGGVRTLALCPTDQLLHICADDSRGGRVDAGRWMSDALTVLKHEIDWERFSRRTAEQRLSVPVTARLELVAREFPGSVSDDALEQLANLPQTAAQRWAHRHMMGGESGAASLLLDLDRHRWASRTGFGDEDLVSLPRYLLQRHRVHGWAPVAGQVARSRGRAWRVFWRVEARIRHAMQRGFERFYGVQTAGAVYLDELGADADGRVYYDPMPWLPVHRALKRLRPGTEDVFADLGSGKGRMLIVAARFPLKRVIGVEVADQLSEAARRNLESARPRLRARAWELVTADAAQWDVPDDATIIFMYCPFLGTVFAEAVERIFASYDRRPRPLHILYALPAEHNRLMATGRVELVDVRPGQWPARRRWASAPWVITVYRVIPTGASPRRAASRWRTPLRRQAMDRWSGPNDQRFAIERTGRPAPPRSDPPGDG